MRIRVRRITGGFAEGEAVITREPITFLGGVDAKRGVVVERGHELAGKCIAGKILVLPRTKGSTVGSYVIYQMKKLGTAPLAIIAAKADEMLATGAIISDIPLVDSPSRELFTIPQGARLRVNADEGYVEVED
ncbi:aconitase X swivel domain-containing protein [Candidatus Pyrohabitans sp.]